MGADDVRVAYPLFQEEYGGASPTSALQFNIQEIDVHKACSLNRLWHSRLPYIHWSNIVRNKYYICYSAECSNKYYAVGIWSSPVARLLDDTKMLELRRMAIAPDAPKNTASRMIRIMTALIKKKFPAIDKLISYQDTEVHKGTIYAASNWKIACTTKGASWSNVNRKRNKEQTMADKIRWEYDLK